jgi:spermidine synthase
VKKKKAAPRETTMPQALRLYVYFSAAITGAAIMIIEILGAKMLAPFMGTSHFVWTAQIAVTLVALATGYYAGGRLADRSPRLAVLYVAILVAAIYLGLTIAIIEPIAYWCLKFKLATGSLLASGILFFVPLALLAMVGPFLMRVITTSLQNVGANIGRLTSISTLGSFAGTILIGYFLIPFMPNSMTLYLTSGLLMVIVAVYFLVWERSAPTLIALGCGSGLGLVLGFGGVSKEALVDTSRTLELYRSNSNFGLLQVLQDRDRNARYYMNDFLIQNIYDPVEKKSMALFTYMLHDLAQAYTPKIERALCIGLGVGIVPSEFARDGVQVDAVEINPAVVKVAHDHFDCEINNLHINIGDGRQFVNQAGQSYDTVILDAFLGDSSPSHLMSREAFKGIKRILKPEGTLVINSFGEFDTGKNFFCASIDKTLRTVFKSVKVHANGNGNVFFVASESADLKIRSEPDFDDVHWSTRRAAEDAFAGLQTINPKDGIVLTDDFNPVDYYDADNRESHRRRLAFRMRSL